ncbi:PRC-barrel domain-containing protein [Dyadobacter sandarakinus]|uniref:PRC-barrel domain-containing protein n=1 Tax=Dyadobacter sandarakinus TaxID=2747268 RepID=A0ABX7I385_9BACT|nr:PRC-barrel domain-containing protein [Dyadobacter sandarakinus]QRR00250.1 PRC-barrel domain-containing protein [Dyadobacter sandarakinus]
MDLNENTGSSGYLEELGGSDFEIVDDQPDIRGWDVKDTSGRELGEVNELIFDKQSRKVRYLVIDLADNVVGINPRVVLLPIGLATLHESDDDVILAALTADRLNVLPEYEKGKITPHVEARIRDTFTGLAAAVAAGAETYQSHPEGFYEHEHFNDQQFYRNRRRITE